MLQSAITLLSLHLTLSAPLVQSPAQAAAPLPPPQAPTPARSPVAATARSPAAARPNLLLIIADDHAGGTLGIEGDPRQATPGIDSLARQGVLFERAYCNSPLCTPSRQSLITGLLPHAVGVTQLATPLSDQQLTLGEWLSGLGYETAAIGKMHFNSGSAHGFSFRIDAPDWERHLEAHPPRGGHERRPWRPFVDPAREWLNAACQSAGLPAESMQSTFFADQAIAFFARPRAKPFALVVGFYDPHSPFQFPRDWQPRFAPERFPVPPLSERDRHEQPAVFASLSPDEVQGIQAAYFTSLSYVDAQVGRLIKALDAANLAQDTLVAYVGDNGYMLGRHGRFEKHCMYEPAVRIPLVMRWPGHLAPGRRITGLVEMVDILPTALHLMGLPAPPRRQGLDLAPLLQGKPGAKAHDVVFSEYLENEEAMVRSDRYKLIVGTGRRLRQDGYETSHPQPLPGPYQRLFDEVTDPDENTDLSGDNRLSAVQAELLNHMYDRLITTREGLEPVPGGLSKLEAVHWCLVPRDQPPPAPAENGANPREGTRAQPDARKTPPTVPLSAPRAAPRAKT